MNMEPNQAKIVISVTEGRVEISGSESFVTSQIKNFKELIEKSITQIESKATPHVKVADKPKATKTDDTKGIDEYLDVFSIDGEDINIIVDIPGSNKAEQTLNVALLYSYARTLQGQDSAVVDSIRKVCVSHGCFDAPNFSTHIKKGNPKYFVDKGTGKSRSIKLNRPGEKKAKELIDSILQNGGQ